MTGDRASRSGRLRSLVAVMSSMALTAMIFTFSWPMFAIRLDAMGVPADMIGLNTSAQGLGIFFVFWFAPRLITRFGPARLMLAMTGVKLVAVLLCIVFPAYWPWLLLRFVIGAAGSVLWIAGETWVNEMADEKSRGRMMALYSAALGIGTVAGIKIIDLVGWQGDLPFLALAAIVVAAGVPLVAAFGVAPKLEVGDHTPGPAGFLTALRIGLLPVLLNAAFAAVFAAMQAFTAVYGPAVGMSVERAVDILFWFNVGGVALPYAVGWLADRMDRALLAVLLVLFCTVMFCAMGAVLPRAGLGEGYVFVIGGLSASIYAVAMALLGERFRGAALASAAAMFTLMWNAGSTVGPLVVGDTITRFGAEAMPWTLAALSALALPLTIGGWLRRRVRP